MYGDALIGYKYKNDITAFCIRVQDAVFIYFKRNGRENHAERNVPNDLWQHCIIIVVQLRSKIFRQAVAAP